MSSTPKTSIIEKLMDSLNAVQKPFSLADASTKSGLSLNDAKLGLNYLTAEYRGALSVTSEGEILYSFPTGFTKPWHKKELLEEWGAKIKKAGLGALKFIVRAWISIVMIAYVVIFALILLALTFSKGNDRDDNSSSFSGTLMFHTLLRLIFDSLFWTFHPFSPFSVVYDPYDYYYRPRAKKMPFYERVNRFFFGPEEKQLSKEDVSKLVLQEIRAQKGRIGILDVMRVTGFSKEEADPFMAKLMLDYDGDVIVSEEGGIFYEFVSMRKSSQSEINVSVPPIWQKREVVPEFTGNPAGSNMLIAGLNGFNMIMSSVAISNGWTVEKLSYYLTLAKSHMVPELLTPPPQGVPLLLGWVPLIFSATLFLIPLFRALNRPMKKHQVNVKNGKRGILRAILSKMGRRGVKEEELKKAWVEQARAQVDDREFTKEIIRLGGELDTNDAELNYRFEMIEAELKALESARKKASSSEVSVGEVIFSSKN
ncbi:MAG: hypothetical protein KC505_04045 [Myxococcales bacterium]|nr:hypothetical protein [Myxococcales bacterium]USN49950.1 MAG: hypothetical protein H6731_06650 [Myxococcales bacterium]